MKKILTAILVCIISIASFAQTINISTGVATWTVTPTGGLANAITPHPIWASQVTTPVSGTGAKWISPTTSFNVVPGDYIYQTKINVGSTNGSLNLNFQVAADDIIMGLELEDPYGASINLSVAPAVAPKYYNLRKALDTTIKCLKKGEWKLKAKVRFLDAAGGFLLSGSATLQGTCCDCTKPTETNIKFSITTTLGGGTTASASAIGASTSLGNGWTLKEVAPGTPNPCKWVSGGIKWQSTGANINIPAGVLVPGKCYVLTHYVNVCSPKWDPKQCVQYKSICFCVCENTINVQPDNRGTNVPGAKQRAANTDDDGILKEAEEINNNSGGK